MLLTAQRVVSPTSRAHAVNVYQYLHGYVWPELVPQEFLPDSNPGELVADWLPFPGGGNHVVSFFDFVAPDDIEPIELHQRLASVKFRLLPTSNPAVAYWDHCWVRFGNATQIPWQTELGALAGNTLLRLIGR